MKVHQFQHEMRTTSNVLGRKHGIHVVFEGDQAGTDGKRIILPSLPPSKELTQAQVRTMRGYVDHEAGHIRHSDMPRLMDFYDRCAHNGKMDLKHLHNSLEDIWMERRVLDEYKGSLPNISQVMETVKAKEIEELEKATKEKGVSPLEEMNVHSACFAITTVGRKPYGREKLFEAVDLIPEKLQAHAEVWTEHARNCANSEEVITLAKSIYKLLKEDDPELDSNPEDFDPQAGEGMEEGENSPDYREGQEGNPCAGNDMSGEGQEGEGEGKPAWVNVSPTEALNQGEGDGASGAIVCNPGGLQGEYTVYSTEYDVDYRRGEPRKDHGESYVYDVVNSTDYSNYEERKSQITGSILTMKTKLKRSLLAVQRRDWDTAREVGKLDTRRLVAASQGTRNVFKQRKDREELDTVVTVLVDLSGSMGGRKSEVARDCTIALAECLSGGGITFNVVGFCNKRYSQADERKYFRPEPLDTVFFKDFDTPMRMARGAIGKLPDAVGGGNSDYDFICNAINDLKTRPEKRKVLLVLSDGHPANAGYGDHNEIIRHCKEAANQTSRKFGVECVGVGICDDTVKQIYNNNVVVNQVEDLSSAVFNKLTGILIEGKRKL